MTFFKVDKCSKDHHKRLKHVYLHQMDEFLHLRTHPWNNSSICSILKMSKFLKNDFFVISTFAIWDELFVRTHT